MSSPSDYVAPKKSNTGLIIGLVVGGLGLCCVLPALLFGGFGLFAFNKSKGMIECTLTFQDLHKSIAAYAAEHNGKLPDAAKWQDEIRPYYEKAVAASKDRGPFKAMPANGDWSCAVENGSTGIAFNRDLSQKTLKDLAAGTVLLFETDKPAQNLNEPFKPKDPKTGPIFMMGQRRSWIELTTDGKVDVRGPDGKPIEVNTGQRRSGISIETKTSSGQDGA